MKGNRSKRLVWPETAATQVGKVFTPLTSWCFNEMPWLESGEAGVAYMAFQDGLGHWGLSGDGAPVNAEDRLALVTIGWVDKGKMAVLARALSIRGHRASQSCWGRPLCPPFLRAPKPRQGSGSVSEANFLPRGRQELVNGSQPPAWVPPAQPAGRKAAKAADLTKESSITFTCAWCKEGKEGGKNPSGIQKESH